MSQGVSLPFSSQQQLLARLRHLSRLETDFILLTGPSGAGKTHLANLLLEQTSLSYPVMLDAKALDSHVRFRETLLSQWFAGAVFDAQDSLLDSMTRLLAQSLHKRLLIVDNGPWLTDIQLQELAELYTKLPAAVRPFMLLLGSADWAKQVRQQLDDVLQSQVVEVEVPPLTADDQAQLWHALKIQPPDAAQDIHYPGQVIDMMEPQMNINNYRQLLEQKSVKALLTVLIVVILLIVIVSLTSSPDKNSDALAQQDEMGALPMPVPNGSTANTVNNGQPVANSSANNPANPNGDVVVQPWADAQLPENPTIAATDTQTQDDGDKERVVIEDDVVNQLMQRQPSAPVTAQQAPAKPAPAAQAPAPSKPAPAATKPAPANNQSNTAKANLGSVENLKQRSAQRYTLQLMAGRNKSVLEALVNQHKLNPAWIYPRTIDGQPWFVLVQGDYVSAKHARDAVKGLPADLQAAKPWPKPFSQVQKEVQP